MRAGLPTTWAAASIARGRKQTNGSPICAGNSDRPRLDVDGILDRGISGSKDRRPAFDQLVATRRTASAEAVKRPESGPQRAKRGVPRERDWSAANLFVVGQDR